MGAGPVEPSPGGRLLAIGALLAASGKYTAADLAAKQNFTLAIATGEGLDCVPMLSDLVTAPNWVSPALN